MYISEAMKLDSVIATFCEPVEKWRNLIPVFCCMSWWIFKYKINTILVNVKCVVRRVTEILGYLADLLNSKENNN